MDAFGFVLKKTLSRVFFPVGLVLVLGLWGLVLWVRRPGSRSGPLLAAVSLFLLFALSLPFTGWLLLAPLESQYGKYMQPERLESMGVKNIVVLGGGVRPGRSNPADRLTPSSLARLLEGARLAGQTPGSRLVLSGGSFGPGISEARAMLQAGELMGLNKEGMLLEEGSWDTIGQARALARVLGEQPFALVTSAYHMPRAMRVFKALGMKPLAAPTDFRTKGFKLGYNTFLPQAGGLKGVEDAFYEYLGGLWLGARLLLPDGWPGALGVVADGPPS